MSNISFHFNLSDSKITLPSGYEIKIKDFRVFYRHSSNFALTKFFVDNDDLRFCVSRASRDVSIIFGTEAMADTNISKLVIHISKKDDFELFCNMHKYPELYEDDNYSHTAVNYNN